MDDISQVGIATRDCTTNGWGSSDTSRCGVKYTIDTDKIDEYVQDTVVTDDNAEEFANTINQVIK